MLLASWSWPNVLGVLGFILAGALWLLKGANEVKSLLPKRPRPRLEEVQLQYGSLSEEATPSFRCDILVNNIKGDKDCSLKDVKISINGVQGATGGYLGWHDEEGFTTVTSTDLPQTVAVGPSIKVCIVGCCCGLRRSSKNNSLPATVTVKFNIGKPVIKKITALFDPRIERYSFVYPHI